MGNSRNFKYLDELIHSGAKEIVLDSDIVLGDFVTSPQARNFLFCRDLGYWRSHDGTRINPNKLSPQDNVVHYLANPLYENDMSDVFQMSAINGDRFYLQFVFDIVDSSPVKSSSAALDLNGEGDQLMELGGTQVS